MGVMVQLPDDIEQRLRAESPNLDAEAKEAMLVELYRQDRVTHHELGLALGLDRFETDGVLKKHKVTEDLPTEEEYNAALDHLRRTLNK